METTWIAYGAIAISMLTFVYNILATTPKEIQKRVGSLEISNAVQRSDIDNLTKIVTKLATTVDTYVQYRIERNGRR